MLEDWINFEINEQSLVTVYLETPKDFETEIELVKNKGTFRVKASSLDLNKNQDSIIKVRGFKHQNVV